MMEFSAEANTALQAALGHLRTLSSLSSDLSAAAKAASDDPTGYVLKVSRETMAASRAFDLFVSATAASARSSGIFPLVIPRRPQPPQLDKVPAPQPSRRKTRAASTFARSVSPERGGGSPTSPGPVPELHPSSTHSPKKATVPSPPPPPSLKPRASVPSQTAALTAKSSKDASFRSTAAAKEKTAPRTAPETVPSIVSTGAYVLLESLARATLSREASWYIHVPSAEEARVAAFVAGKPHAPTAGTQHLRHGIIGSVIKTGIACNIAPEHPTDTNPTALCVPIHPPQRDSGPIGAVILRKKATNTAFTTDDESLATAWSILAAHVATGYGVDLTEHWFDPFRVLLHHVTPWSSFAALGLDKKKRKVNVTGLPVEARHASLPPAEEMMLEELIEDTAAVLERQATGGGGGEAFSAHQAAKAAGLRSYGARLASAVATFPPMPKVFRCTHHTHYAPPPGSPSPWLKSQTAQTLPTQNLHDVAEYLTNLENCWRQAADDLQGIEGEHTAQLASFRARKKEVISAETRLRSTEAERDVAVAKYEALKRDLTVLCERPVDALLTDGLPQGTSFVEARSKATELIANAAHLERAPERTSKQRIDDLLSVSRSGPMPTYTSSALPMIPHTARR